MGLGDRAYRQTDTHLPSSSLLGNIRDIPLEKYVCALSRILNMVAVSINVSDP